MNSKIRYFKTGLCISLDYSDFMMYLASAADPDLRAKQLHLHKFRGEFSLKQNGGK